MFIAVCMMVFCISNDFALADIEVNTNGEVRQVESSWRKLTFEEIQAQAKPGELIPIYTNWMIKKIDFFHIVQIQEGSQYVTYRDGKFEYIDKKISVQGEPVFLNSAVILLLSICLMIFSNIVYYKGVGGISVYAGCFASGVMAFMVHADAATLTAFIIAISSSFGKNKVYWIMTAIFYALIFAELFT